MNRPRDGQRAWLLDFEEDGSGIALRVRIEGADLTVEQKEVLALVAGPVAQTRRSPRSSS